MTDINPAAEAARESARQATGKFGAQEHSAPEAQLNPRAELDTVNALYQANTQRIQEEVGLYLLFGMPEAAHRVEFEPSDHGDYLYAARAFDKDGRELDTEEEYDRWSDVDDVISHLGHPDDNRSIRDLLPETGNGVHTWTRTEATNDADELAIRERIEKLDQVRRELGEGSQAAAVTAVRRMLPEGSRLILTWGDQPGPDYLSAHTLILADATELDSDAAYDAGFDWDEIDGAASDIRDTSDHNITQLDTRGNYFALDQKAV